MGVVYAARDTRLDRSVAVKVLRAETARDADDLLRFETEARAVSALNHPNILIIHDVGTHAGVPYFVSELLHGRTLRRCLADGRLPLRKAMEYTRQIAAGLAAAHDKGIVHRDLKPENVFITDEGRVKILDFGVARITRPEAAGTDPSDAVTEAVATQPGVAIGTMGYMSPEQIRGQRVDLSSDVFSLGVVLYELVCGERPFKGDTSVDIATAILREDVFEIAGPYAGLPASLVRVIQHCLEKKPEERFHSAREVLFALETLAVVPDPPLGRSGSPSRRHVTALVAVAGFSVAAAAGLLVGTRITSAPPALVFHQLTARRGFVLSARFARDGESVLYGAAWDGRPVELFSTPAQRADSTLLPIPSADVLSVSPSGELALSLSRRYLDGFATTGTLARGTAGSAPRDLLENVQDAEWDGNDELIVTRRVAGKYRLEWPIGRVVDTAAGWISHPRLSPEGDRLSVFEHLIYGDDRGAVVIIDRQGGRTVVSDGWSSLSGLDWAPSGDKVWFSAAREGTRRELVELSISGKVRTLLRVPGSLTLYDVAPDGRVLLSQETLRSIAVGVAPDGTERDLSWTDFSIGHDLSIDGRTALLSEGGVGTSALYAAYLRGMDGSPAIRLGEGQPMALSPDQRWVLMLMLRTPPELLLLPTRAGSSRRLPRGEIETYSYVASWFPDGKQVLFQASDASGHERLYSQSIDGGEPLALTPEGVHLPIFTDPISPDGQVIAALGPDERLRLYSLRGGAARIVEGLAVAEMPLLWSRDGTMLFTVERLSSSRFRINKVDLARQRKATVRDIAPPVAGLMSILHVHAAMDAQAYIYSYWQRLSDLYVVEGVR
jgi:hypothetical protein